METEKVKLLKESDDETTDDELTLTSNYDFEDDDVSTGAASLFSFLMKSGFASILPFLSITLRTQGYSRSQIGTLNGITYLISGLFVLIWSNVTRKYNDRKTIMIASVLAWIIFMFPVYHSDFYDKHNNCPSSSNATNSSILLKTIDSNKRTIQGGFGIWNKMDFSFLLVLAVFVSGRMIQAATDYYNTNNQFVLRVEITSKKTEPQRIDLTTNISAAIIAIFVGYILDSISICDKTAGHFRPAYYIFGAFLTISALLLYFLEIEPYTDPSYQNPMVRKSKKSKIKGCYSPETIIVVVCLIYLGACAGVHQVFLYERMYSINSLFLQIGLAYAVHVIAETFHQSLMHKFLLKFSLFEILFVCLCSEAARNLLYSYVSTRTLAWIIVPMEILSGFQILLGKFTEIHFKSSCIAKTHTRIIFHTYHTCIGFSFGPIIFGFLSDVWTNVNAFRLISALTLLLAISLAFLLLNDNKEQRILSNIKNRENESESDDDDDNVQFLSDKTRELDGIGIFSFVQEKLD